MPSLNHIHRYQRFNKSQYKCMDPYCTHFIDKAKILGKAAICAVCGNNEIILTSEMLKLARPACVECSNTKAAREFRERRALLAGLFPEEKKEDSVA